jgi:hypothetical protein
LKLARFRLHLLVAVALGLTLALFAQPPIHQSLDYHRFADTRTLLGVPNYWNVVSNLPFLFVGLFGLAWTVKHNESIVRETRAAWLVLFGGVALVGLGSGWYHLSPSRGTLVWDRLPMTLAFMALLAIVRGEHIALRLARMALYPLLLAGVASVLYWRSTDDLRPYALVQFLPVLLIPLILCSIRARAAARSGSRSPATSRRNCLKPWMRASSTPSATRSAGTASSTWSPPAPCGRCWQD